jgi:hypothetical protein
MFNSAIWLAGEGSQISGEWILPAPVKALRPYNVLGELPVGMSTAITRDCAVTRLMKLRFDTLTFHFVAREDIDDEGEIREEGSGEAEPDEEGIRAFVDRYGLFGLLHQDATAIHGTVSGWRRERGQWIADEAVSEPGAILDKTYHRPKSHPARVPRLEADYFPSGFPTAEVPPPTAPEFFGTYAEKLEQWWETALLVGEAIRDDDRAYLDSLLSVAGIGLTKRADRLLYQSHFPSLLSAIVAQYVNARRDGLYLRICANEVCPRVRVFFGVERARFCSPYCQNAQHQRERRNRALLQIEQDDTRRQRAKGKRDDV